jgi:hypothetical protein
MGFPSRAAALAITVTVACAAPDAAAQPSPLSRVLEGGSPFGDGVQVRSLWYYGPSYSLRYDRPPTGAGQPYRPSLRNDPYFGPDYADRLERGRRFGPVPEWPRRFDAR